MSGFVEFLRARLDEDEAVAKAAAAAHGEEWTVDSSDGRAMIAGSQNWGKYSGRDLWDCEGASSLCTSDAAGVHIARHDPRRGLGDVAAKREIVDGYAELHEYVDVEEWSALNWAVRLLAAVYSDHPDYQKEWA